jgi:hypothetical protein
MQLGVVLDKKFSLEILKIRLKIGWANILYNFKLRMIKD